MRGTYVALLGIDGSGKSSVAAALRAHLERAGREVVDAGPSAVYARARAGGGHPWDALDRMVEEGWRLYLARPPRQSAVVASGLLEFDAYCLVRAEVIDPALARGAVVISDSFCLKNVVRTLLQARHLDGGLSAAVDGLLDGVRVALSSRYLQPDVGLLLDADPVTAARWRLAQRGGIEPGADLAVAGRPGYESFVALQTELAARLRAAVAQWGWHVLPVDGRPLDRTVATALELLGTADATGPGAAGGAG